MRDNLARLKEVFEEEADPVISQLEPKYLMQQQRPRYPDDATRRLAILQQQMEI